VVQSEDQHPGLAQLKVALDIAKLETAKAEAGHKPTLDLTGSYTMANSQKGTSSSSTNYDTRSNVATVGLSFNLPLFAGFATQNRIKETLALEEKARTDLEASRRSIAQATRTAFFGVQSGQAQVKAYEAAEASSQSALDANKLGYQVGVRINIDVLNSQSQLYSTKATLAKARYDVLVGGLKLKQAAGTLKAEDLAPINSQLVP
jgi:outer membrane protein